MDTKQFQEDIDLFIGALNDGEQDALKEAYDTRNAHWDSYTQEQRDKVEYLWDVI